MYFNYVYKLKGEKNNSILQVKSVKIKNDNITLPVCKRPVVTRCETNCSNDVIMAMATATKFEGSIFGLHQFWSLVIVLSFFWISQAITWNLQDPICFDLLGNFNLLSLLGCAAVGSQSLQYASQLPEY